MKIQVWPNKLGFDYGKWECLKCHDGSWMARKFASKEDKLPYMFGYGNTYLETITTAIRIED